jgi:hypothetical protein
MTLWLAGRGVYRSADDGYGGQSRPNSAFAFESAMTSTPDNATHCFARRSFAAARDGQGAGTGYSPWLGRTLLPASENLARSREYPGP